MIEFLAPIAARVKTLYDALTTSTRMANLDNLDAAVSGISPIRSIQSGTITMGTSFAVTATVAAVTIGKSALIHQGCDAAGASTPADYNIRLTLTNATTVTADRNGSGNSCHVRWTLVEFK